MTNAAAERVTPSSIDLKDIAILAELQADARLTVAQLAERVHLSTSPAWRRVKRLESDGLITGYHAALSRRGLGWGVLAFVSVAIESHSEQEARAFETAIAALPEIVACWSIAGTSDFLLQVVACDLDSYADFAMTTIRRLPGIKAMQTALTLKEVKALTPWPVPGHDRAAAKPKKRRWRRAKR
jgi:Lrp/AsnC family transcriptional regulator, leucine-responsive regulatory protein